MGSDDMMRGVLRYRASSSRSLPEDFQTEAGPGCYLGICSLGAVVRTLHVPTNSECALKRISKKLLCGPAWRSDVEKLQDLDHPHICRTFDVFEDSASVYIVMELCRGGNLNNLAQLSGHALSEANVAVFVYQMVQAVTHLHSLGVVHCDMCPENWLIEKSLNTTTPPSEVKLKMIDFGLSSKYGRESPRNPARYMYPNVNAGNSSVERRLSRVSNTSSTQTSRSGRSRKSSKGENKKPLSASKLFCQAPEQLDPPVKPSPAMDIWAIGVLSHFLLLGTSPFEPSKGVTNPADNLAFRNARYVFMPAEVWRHISNDAKSFIALCLEREPESRPTAKMLLSMPWMRMARSMLEGTALTMPMTMPEKEEDLNSIPALSSMDTSSTPRSRSMEISGPAWQIAQMNLLRFREYQALERDIIISVAHEVHPHNLETLRDAVKTKDLDGCGFVLWVVLMSCVRQCGASLADMDLEIPELAEGWVNYNDFMADLVLFQKNMQESSMWFVFSCFDANGRGEADRRQIHRDLGNGKALLHQCVATNFPGVSIDTVRQTIGQASGRVKFEELFDALHSAAYEGKTSKDKPFSQRF